MVQHSGASLEQVQGDASWGLQEKLNHRRYDTKVFPLGRLGPRARVYSLSLRVPRERCPLFAAWLDRGHQFDSG